MKEIITVVDWKTFDSINRSRIFKILSAYGTPRALIDIISVSHADTCAKVIIQDGETKNFKYPKEYYRATQYHLSYSLQCLTMQ